MSTIKRSELDAAVAVEVMGWWAANNGFWAEYGTNHNKYRHTNPASTWAVWRPSTDIRHAFEALVKWCGDAAISSILYSSMTGYCVLLARDEDAAHGSIETKQWKSEHESLAIAICLALLGAVRGEQVELED